MRTTGCPLCGRKTATETAVSGVYECKHCHAIYGTCYLGDSYTLVKPYMDTAQVPVEQMRYYDLDCLGSAGRMRRHGWYNPASGLIVQTG